MTIELHGLNFFGPSLVYTSADGREMDDISEHCDEDQFANSQSRRDLRVFWDVRELKTQLMEAIDTSRGPFATSRFRRER